MQELDPWCLVTSQCISVCHPVYSLPSLLQVLLNIWHTNFRNLLTLHQKNNLPLQILTPAFASAGEKTRVQMHPVCITIVWTVPLRKTSLKNTTLTLIVHRWTNRGRNASDNRVLMDYFVLQLTKILSVICVSKTDSSRICKVILLGLSTAWGFCV